MFKMLSSVEGIRTSAGFGRDYVTPFHSEDSRGKGPANHVAHKKQSFDGQIVGVFWERDSGPDRRCHVLVDVMGYTRGPRPPVD